MVFGGSQWFSLVLIDYHAVIVFMVLGSYERFSVVLNGSLWFSIVFNVSLWFSVVTSNSYWLPVVLNCYYLVVHNGFRWF